ncbi:predicted protein [Arabidopsis lyrata subsp. lyrata]|uniref:Predicted protein n=1 Tax=Arabidopsis lyrata subsp. lyrata TaxID=81972 RepID=D7KNZ0_ARALL|nr:predicted protein [Arabidopsis lyrata subsp. lyrata]
MEAVFEMVVTNDLVNGMMTVAYGGSWRQMTEKPSSYTSEKEMELKQLKPK